MRRRFRARQADTKKLLAPEKLRSVVEQLAEELKTQPAALVGGYALQQFGSPRLTGDLDIVTTEIPKSLPVDALLSFGGIRPNSRVSP